MELKVTRHAKYRIKKRLGISKKLSEKVSEKALAYGKTHNDFAGSFNRYLNYIYHQNIRANNIRVYNDNIFLFQNSILITVLKVPYKYRKYLNKDSSFKKEISYNVDNKDLIPFFKKTGEQVKIINDEFINGKEAYRMRMANNQMEHHYKKDIGWTTIEKIPENKRMVEYVNYFEANEIIKKSYNEELTQSLADKLKKLM